MKNASSLLDNNDPVKLEAEAMLNDLIRWLSFYCFVHFLLACKSISV